MIPCRLFIDPPGDGAWNMAVDEVLLSDAADRGAASLRFYQWREPTLSLGYFQAYADRECHEPSREIPAVRRLSGGGALVHDRELTYSLCLPSNHVLSRQSALLYGRVHEALIAALAAHGIATRLCGAAAKLVAASAASEPFLCFLRRRPDDVVAEDGAFGRPSLKLAGSAQRRRRGAVLQHGALLLARSAAAPELPGIAEVSDVEIAAVKLVALWISSIAASLGLQLTLAGETLPAIETSAAPYAQKFQSPQWTRRR